VDEGFFFIEVGEVCRRTVITCSAGEDVLSVAARMKEKSISGVVVCREEEPIGIITDRDFRNQLERVAGAPGRVAASDIMSSPLITIRADEHVFEAIYRMSRHRIHRLVVVDSAGRLAGIITDTDVLMVQTTTPIYFSRDIDEAQSTEDLRKINGRTVDIVSYACRSGAGTGDLVRLISHFYDRITQRVIELLLREEHVGAAPRFAFLALGSEGRREQTLKTDQDNAIVYADDLDQRALAGLEAFSARLIETLVHIGVPPCPGGTMANNPKWRRSVSEWSRLVESWISSPQPENMVNFGMFCDLRTIYGPPEYERELKEVIRRTVGRNDLFLAYMARNILRFPPPLGLFGRLKTERAGPHKGKIDLKKAGIFALTEGVTLVALRSGITDGSTREKIQALKESETMAARDLEAIQRAFESLFYLRLRHQLEQSKTGVTPDNCILPSSLSTANLSRLKEALGTVQSFQRHLREEYELDRIPH
jgi:CBS domain-containing protein